MGIDDIWTDLAPETRDWLIANNGDAVPADIAAEIDAAIDSAGADDVWADGDETTGGDVAVDEGEPDDPDDEDLGARYLTDEAVDWIEELANDDE